MRQMERLARQGADKPTDNTGGSSKKGTPKRSGNSSLSRSISTKVCTNDNKSVSNGAEKEKNGFDDDNEEYVMPEGSSTETVTGACEIPINISNENLIEIVNDIADAEIYTKDTKAGIENVYIDKDESVDIQNETKETENSESQVCGTDSSSKSGKKASRVGGRKKKVQEDEFESVAKEVLYKHLNEFIPSIDADILKEKIDLIAKELSETRGQQNTGVQKRSSVKPKKATKNLNIAKEKKNDTTSDNVSVDVDYINGSMKDSVGIKLSSETSADIHAVPEYGTHEPILAKKTSKSTKPRIVKNTNASESTMHSPSSNNRELRQMLSSATSNRPNLFSLYRPPVQESEHKDKPFLSAALRNMLSPSGPNSVSNQIATMAACPPAVPMETIVKKENHSSNSSSVGSSTVLRNMLSTPPKHYLISTKNSYAALQYAKKRQTTESGSQNGFPGVWHVPGQVVGASDFPWVNEDVTLHAISVPSVSNPMPSVYDTIPSVGLVKIEPVSP